METQGKKPFTWRKSPPAKVLTIEDLKVHPLYNMLSSKQQQFLLAYIESSGDRLLSVEKAYGTAKGETTAIRLLRNPNIRKLIALFYGYEIDQAPMGKTELLGLIAARLRNMELGDAAFVKLAEVCLEAMAPRQKTGRPTKEESEEINDEVQTNIDELVQQVERKIKTKGQL